MPDILTSTTGIRPIPYQIKDGVLIVPQSIKIIPTCAFEGNHDILQVDLHDCVYAIESRAFSCCECLQNVCLPNGLEAIGDFAFSSCCMKKIVIPPSVTHIGECAFSSCETLAEVHIMGNPSLGSKAFANCQRLRLVHFANPCNHIDTDVFEKEPCIGFKSEPIEFHIPDGIHIRKYD